MKMFFQLLSQETGVRSEAVGCSRDQAGAVLAQMLERESVKPSDYVLVLVDDVTDAEWNFSTAPLMSVANFIERYKEKNHG